MTLTTRLTLLLPATISLLIYFAPVVFADAKSDYDYQYGQYRRNYSEFNVLKQDYLQTPSLDNQQKGLLSAKLTIRSRELAKASLNQYILNSIRSYEINYPPLVPIADSLDQARLYHLNEAQKSQVIASQDDLANFTKVYSTTIPTRDSIIKFGLVANKIAALVRIQLDSQAALDSLSSKLPSQPSIGLLARLKELNVSTKVIDDKISALANSLKVSEVVEETSTDIFYTSRIEKLIEIRELQLDWINRLIDIDKSYVQPKI